MSKLITGYLLIKVKLKVADDVTADLDDVVKQEFVQELDYNITSKTKGVEVLNTEIDDATIHWHTLRKVADE